ncbi:RNA polymerase sigma factor [Fulvivirga ligni]|uniref:RNA polymerase sigma factor n=1 Tax=Fulvivirga ligni TaxID=2904246 RepID=UPI001F2763FF|nr:sigma-70 family RNA polymerase sigma factor [Fulvivirga ligni]UII19994.1 sigma-70 family RNA polymerase sigma factor [Fulvivirga ligni]
MNISRKYDVKNYDRTKEQSSGEKFMVHSSEGEVWNAFKAGDEAAFIKIYEKYFDVLVNYCFQFTQDEDLIKDCVQDLFIFIRNKRSTLSPTDNIKLYLLKACRNRLISYLKKQHVIKSYDDLGNDSFVPVLSTEDNIINLQTREIKEEKLNRAIQKLSIKEREMIYYFYFQNMSYESIRELMDYDHVKSVRSLLYKALTKLKGFFVFLSFPLADFLASC